MALQIINGFRLDLSGVRSPQRTLAYPTLKQLSEEELGMVLEQAPPYLFPDDRAFFGFLPYRIMKDNAQVMYRDSGGLDPGPLFLTTGLQIADDRTLTFTPESLVLSSRWAFVGRQGEITYLVDMYGSKANDTEIQKHLKWHVEHLADLAISTGKKEAVMEIYYRRSLKDVMGKLRFRFACEWYDSEYSPFTVLEKPYML